jgi:hypothetical protein
MHKAFGIIPEAIYYLRARTVSKPSMIGIFKSRNITTNPAHKHYLQGEYFLSSHLFKASTPFNAFSVFI